MAEQGLVDIRIKMKFLSQSVQSVIQRLRYDIFWDGNYGL